ncbi:zinc finger, CCHC-type containing protein [Tanacetum coccineum]|uniref:Zinc finger, CCHC-type containing protein n=1 Tax=Tanacetum coccineum TaxID=301880 RepID=A0ABQ5BMR6_9ASTR
MSDFVPFDIQSEIMKRLPVKSLLQFRSVSKQWKSFIDSPKFIKSYHVNHTNPQHHLLVVYKVQKLRWLLFGILLSVDIDIPIPKAGCIVAVGFGVCRDTSDPKLVKISVDKISSMWVVKVFVNGVFYVRAYDDASLDDGVRSNFVISFDLKSEKFGEVCLPEKLVRNPYLDVAKVNESLGLLEYYDEGDIPVCDVGRGKMVLIKLDDDDDEGSRIEVYEPLSGHTNGVGIHEKACMFTARCRDQAVVVYFAWSLKSFSLFFLPFLLLPTPFLWPDFVRLSPLATIPVPFQSSHGTIFAVLQRSQHGEAMSLMVFDV